MALQHMLRAVQKGSASLPITFISQTTQVNTATGANLVLTTPSGVQVDDVLVAIGFNSRSGAGVTWTPPTGFTEVYDQGGQPNLFVAYRIATGTETSTYTFTASNATQTCAGTMLCYRNAKWATIGAGNPGQGSASTSITALGVSSGINSSQALAIFGDNRASNTFTTPSGFTSRASSSGAALSWAVFDSPESGDIPDTTSTMSTASSVNNAITVLLAQKDSALFSAYSSSIQTGINTTVTSSSFTITSGSGAVTLSSGLTFNKNGGAYASSGSVVTGDVITLRYTTGASFDVIVPATFTVSGTTYTYTVSTASVLSVTTSQSFVVPNGVTSMSMLALGAGGGGAAPATNSTTAWGGGGGGSGALSYTNNVAVTAGETLTITIGTGGAYGYTSAATSGTASSIARGATILVSANGGSANTAYNTTSCVNGGAGGTTTGTGTVKFAGGAGGTGASIGSGGSNQPRCGNGGNSPTTAAAGTTGGFTASGSGATGTGTNFGTSSQTTAAGGAGAGGGGNSVVWMGSSWGLNFGTNGVNGAVVLLWNSRTFSTATTY